MRLLCFARNDSRPPLGQPLVMMDGINSNSVDDRDFSQHVFVRQMRDRTQT
jgi:hypothetical protein